MTPRLSARIASSAQALGGGASDTCLVDTSDTDFQAGTLTSCDATTSPGDVYEVQSGPCVVTDHTLTSTAPGTCVIAANQPGDTGYNAAPAVTASVTTAETDNGCSCRSANPSPASGVWILIVAFGLRRRRRASR